MLTVVEVMLFPGVFKYVGELPSDDGESDGEKNVSFRLGGAEGGV